VSSIIGYHASHEQFPPSRLLAWTQRAEAAGFGCAMCSDHLMPWSERQGESGFAWSWLGSALQATSFSLGVVNAPIDRYGPVIVAHAAATLAEMYPGRFWLAVGSGEHLNEHVTGEPWPSKGERNARLLEAVAILRALWRGERVTHEGRFFRLVDAQLYTLPAAPPLLVGAAITPATANWVAGWADALITVSRPPEELRTVVDAFRLGGGEGKPMLLQSKHAYAATDAQALAGAHDQWRTNVMPSAVMANLALPEAFDAAARFVRPDDMHPHVRVSADLERHAAWLAGDLALGFDRIYVHDVHPDQERFIDDFGERVLPQFAHA
jgi:coenzyme F420-dependent glucose-6-phosphate dehydrogenase